jgi:hypothetical protein
MNRSLVLAFVSGILFIPTRAVATESPSNEPSPAAHLHDGLHLKLSGAFAVTSFAEEGSTVRSGAWAEGPTDTLLVGATPWRGVVVGGGVHASFPRASFQDGRSVSAVTGTVGPFVDWYPDPKDGWHIGALAGVGLVRLQAPATSETSGTLGVMVMAGYDWWILPEWSLGVDAMAAAATDGSPLDYGSNGPRYRIAPLSAGLEVGLTFH